MKRKADRERLLRKAELEAQCESVAVGVRWHPKGIIMKKPKLGRPPEMKRCPYCPRVMPKTELIRDHIRQCERRAALKVKPS